MKTCVGAVVFSFILALAGNASAQTLYRTVADGNWTDNTIWEQSIDGGATWNPAASSPTSADGAITVRSPNTVNILNTPLTIDETTVEFGAALENAVADPATFQVANGAGDDLIIFGEFRVSENPPGSTGTIRVKTNGRIEVRSNAVGGNGSYASNPRFFYETNAEFFWNPFPIAAFVSSGATYFPNAAETDIPIFRSGISTTVGAGATTVINGILEVDAGRTLTWSNGGIKTFRNGIRGDGDVTQNSNSGQFLVSGDTAVIGGTGVINLNATSAAPALLISNTASLNLLSNKTINTATAEAVQVDGTLNAQANVLSGTAGFTLASGGTLITANTGGVKSSIALTGTKTFNAAARYVFNGAATQNAGLTTTPVITNARYLEIDNAAGVTLDASVTATDSLALNRGVLTTTPSFTAGLGSSTEGTLIATDTGWINGTFVRFKEAAATTLLFPVGTAANRRPLIMDFTAAPTAGTIAVSNTDGAGSVPLTPPVDDAGFILTNRSEQFWSMASLITGGTYNLSLNPDGQSGITELATLRVIRSPDGGVTFDPPGTHTAATVFGADTLANRNGIVGLYNNQFYLAGSSTTDNPLPVSLLAFTASATTSPGGMRPSLQWTTASETDNAGFMLYRNGNLIASYQTVASLTGSGTRTSERTYNYIDTALPEGTYRYELRSQDYSGQVHAYFNGQTEITLTVPLQNQLRQNYPNPFNPATVIGYQLSMNSEVSLKVYDVLGREVASLVGARQAAGNYTASFNASKFSSGMYFYRLSVRSAGANFTATKQMMFLK
ncbi:MAG: T9SS type A sorting domain-containing protein [Rhizobacter sp.]|nr:T9SS type A sorting domain-containing protein [Chlorobiales bacterium]